MFRRACEAKKTLIHLQGRDASSVAHGAHHREVGTRVVAHPVGDEKRDPLVFRTLHGAAQARFVLVPREVDASKGRRAKKGCFNNSKNELINLFFSRKFILVLIPIIIQIYF